MRSRAVSLPRSCWRRTDASEPACSASSFSLPSCSRRSVIGWGLGVAGRSGGVVSHAGQARPGADPEAYSCTSSMRVPNAVFGCTNATVVPRLPGRGCSSMTR